MENDKTSTRILNKEIRKEISTKTVESYLLVECKNKETATARAHDIYELTLLTAFKIS